MIQTPLLTRRDFIRAGFYGALFLSCGSQLNTFSSLFPTDADPVATLLDLTSEEFAGDEETIPHDVLRFGKGRNLSIHSSAKHNLVIVGGGMAGLCSAYFLKKYKPVVLEQAERFGGNSKGEEWEGIPYSIGAAYITVPEKGSVIENFLGELGILSMGRMESGREGAVVLDRGELARGFWQGATDPSQKSSFEKVLQKFNSVYEKGYPSIPFDPEGSLGESEWKNLEEMTFAQWILRELPDLHPHIQEFLIQYCWSSFGGGADEISAAQALNFISADLQGTLAFPGGNSAITQALYRKLKKNIGSSCLRSRSVVTEIALRKEGVSVTYRDEKGQKNVIEAKVCVVALPKFVAKHIMPDLSLEQKEAMAQIRYRAYLVANVLIKGKITSPSYELFRLTRTIPRNNTDDLLSRPFTDLIFANWVRQDEGNHSVLTLYKAYPFEGGRFKFLEPDFYQKAKEDFEKGFSEILSALNLSPSRIAGIRIARWGHALPLATPGFLSSGLVQKACAPLGDKIFFAEQDNWANPSFETAFDEAQKVAENVNRLTSLSF